MGATGTLTNGEGLRDSPRLRASFPGGGILPNLLVAGGRLPAFSDDQIHLSLNLPDKENPNRHALLMRILGVYACIVPTSVPPNRRDYGWSRGLPLAHEPLTGSG